MQGKDPKVIATKRRLHKSAKINDADIERADIKVGNGIIYIIAKAL